MGIRVDAAAYNLIGGRKNNEDNFYLNGIYMSQEQMNQGGKVSANCSDSLQIYGVFDGMGGGAFGELASCYAAQQLKIYQSESEHADNEGYLSAFLTQVSMGIDEIARSNALSSGACGSTAAILIIGDWWYRTAHVGDSRIYLLRDKHIRPITKDQSEVQRLVDQGKIKPSEAWGHPRKNVITHHLGMPLRDEKLESIISDRMPLQAGDCFLICSDGVSDNLRDEEIDAELDATRSAEENASKLVQRAKKSADERGVESDNITAVVANIQSVAGSDEPAKRVRKLATLQKIAMAGAALLTLGAVGSLIQLIRMLTSA